MTIKKRFMLLIGGLVAIVLIEGGVLFLGNNKMLYHATFVSEREIPTLNKSHELKLAVVQVQQWLTDISATRGLDGLNDGFEEAENNAKLFRKLIAELTELNPNNAERYQLLVSLFKPYFATGKRMAQAYIDEGPAAGNKMMAEFDAVAANMTKEVDSLLLDVKAQTEAALAEETSTAWVNKISLLVGSLIVLLGIGVIYIIMARTLSYLPRIAQQISEGDLTTSLKTQRKDEIGQILNAVDGMLGRLINMVSQINDISGQLSTTSSEMTQQSSETRDSIQQLYSEAEQSATAINEMTATTQEVTKNISHAASAAQEANNETSVGQQVVDKTISQIKALASQIDGAANTIHELESDSQNISSVLDVIKGIAEQTNLLALNAAIEAARAGEQGRGFAVVADEVRTLASRTQESTSEINQMIDRLQSGAHQAVEAMNSSCEQARSAVEQATSAGTSLSSISSAVGLIDEMNAQIASAMKEQEVVADEVNRNIVRISDLAGRSTAAAEHAATSSHHLSESSSNLEGLVEHFKV